MANGRDDCILYTYYIVVVAMLALGGIGVALLGPKVVHCSCVWAAADTY